MSIQNILQKIYDSGLNDKEISKAITANGHKVSQPVINRLRRGVTKQTFHERYEASANLYKKVFKKKYTECAREK